MRKGKLDVDDVCHELTSVWQKLEQCTRLLLADTRRRWAGPRSPPSRVARCTCQLMAICI
jgi:hypothetical protein